METLANHVESSDTRKGTGKVSSEIKTGVWTGVILVEKSWRHTLSSDTFNTAYIKDEIKKHNMFPFLGAINNEPNNEERGLFTTSTKVSLKTVNGLPGVVLEFSAGPYFHKAAWEFNSFAAYDAIKVYDNGVLSLVDAGGGKLKGHDLGLFDTDTFMDASGNDPQKTRITMQFLDAEEYNKKVMLLDPTANSFNMKDITGIIDVNVTDIAAGSANTDVDFKVSADANSGLYISGLAATDFRAVKTGLTATISSISEDTATNTYTLTFSADVSSDVSGMKLELYDSTNSLTVIEHSNKLYEGSGTEGT